jgi:hypothetical protein
MVFKSERFICKNVNGCRFDKSLNVKTKSVDFGLHMIQSRSRFALNDYNQL